LHAAHSKPVFHGSGKLEMDLAAQEPIRGKGCPEMKQGKGTGRRRLLFIFFIFPDCPGGRTAFILPFKEG